MKTINRFYKKLLISTLTVGVLVSSITSLETLSVKAETVNVELTTVNKATAKGNVVTVEFNEGIKAKITFLEDNIFRYNVDPKGVFSAYATDNNRVATARIPQYPDDSENYKHPAATVSEDNDSIIITANDTVITFGKSTGLMSVSYKGKTVMSESKPLSLGANTVQSIKKNTDENYYGGGTQNGRFVHTNEVINIANESNWVDGGVASPNPFYYSSNGYGVLRNTFLPGAYDLGKSSQGEIYTIHNENEYDAYIFLANEKNVALNAQKLLQGYYHVTGNPVLLPEYAFYEGHLNCYNRDAWNDTGERGKWEIKGSSSATKQDSVPYAQTYYESGQASGFKLSDGQHSESLMGKKPTVHKENYPESVDTPEKYSAKGVIDQYVQYDMPIGYFLPNDGYGCGYGQNGYYKTGGVNNDGSSSAERIAAIDANVDNLKEFTNYAQSKGLETGLWTQSNLTPDSNNATSWHLLRDFEKEVVTGGITTLKTDVAWVGHGYNFALNGLKQAYDIVTDKVSKRPNIITLDGWAATQRFAGIWTGDQTGGNWEYIRFHVPTYIGQSLSGNPNVGSDMDGIFGGSRIISTRDTQWKIFTPLMLNMDGWGTAAKTPHTFGDPYTGINRMYLKLKAQLMPYIYTSAASAANINTGNNDTGMPMIRAMFLEYPNDSYANTKAMQYQYMFGPSILVAPVYTETNKIDELGNDIRNDIYLPDSQEIWIDYFTGEQYFGGQAINNFEVPIWKLPVFVKNGAIIPMWEENNNPSGVDKTNRIVEFWPDGKTEYTMFEDDGKSANTTLKEVKDYGVESTVSYGDHVSTKFTSDQKDGNVTITVDKAVGKYDGYNANKNTVFVVNTRTNPSKIVAKNGADVLSGVQKNSKEEVLNAKLSDNQYAYYYDENPQIEYYSVDIEDEFKEMMQGKTSSGKLYVKFASNNQDVNTQTLVLEGFNNTDPKLGKNELNSNLVLPEEYEVKDVVESKTPTSNTIMWDAVENATGYDVEADGVINTVLGNITTFTHRDLQYKSTHTYRVRARNSEGYSEWSSQKEFTTLDNPWKDTPVPEHITWNGGDNYGKLSNATDHNLSSNFHSAEISSSVPMILDYGIAYELDKFVYYPRNDYNPANGDVYRMNLYTSLDGINWKLQHDGSQVRWTYNSDKKLKNEDYKEIDLTGTARYIKLEILESQGNFFSANELLLYRQPDKKGFAVGSTKFNPTVQESDYTNMKNYLGQTGQTFNDQIKAYHGDINDNGIYDVYDYSFTMFNLDGGTQAKGEVSGNILLLPNKEFVAPEETFTINVYADNVKNLNAFGQVITFDSDKLEYVKVEQDPSIKSMEDLTISYVNTGNPEYPSYVNLAFANRGNKVPYSGTGVLATITMKAKGNINVHEAMNLTSVTLIGPRHDVVVTTNDGKVEDPTISQGTSGNYTYDQDFTMSMTNEHLTSDDGSNVTKLVQQAEGYAKLFDNSKGREFEFKWDIPGNYVSTGELPAMVTLPLDLHLALNKPQPINNIKIYDCAVVANGYLTKASATIKFEDDSTIEVAEIVADNSDGYVFDLVNTENSKNVKEITLHLLESKSGLQHLTLAEIEVYNADQKLQKSDFNISITNQHLTSDDGNNVTKLIQQNNYDSLFDGNTAISDRGFELKWDIAANHEKAFPSYVRIPVTLSATMKDGAKPLNSVSMFNAGTSASNGWVKKANVVFYYEDNTQSDPVEITNDNLLEFVFNNPSVDKNVTKVDLTITEATCASNAPANSQLTLGELEYKFETKLVAVTDITVNDMKTEIYQGEIVDVVATITPDNATNPYYKVTSDNLDVVQIVKLVGADGLPIYKLHGMNAGEANIKVTALENEQIVKEVKIAVKEGVNKVSLENAIKKYGNAIKEFYTEDSYTKYQEALNNANTIVGNVSATSSDVNKAIEDLENAYTQLVELPVSEISGEFTADALYSENNVAGKAFDGDLTTYWESPYGGENAKLPQTLTINLNKLYNVNKLDIISHNIQNGGLLEYTIEVSENGQDYVQVYSASDIDSDIYKHNQNVTLGNRFKYIKGQYVRINITKAVGRIEAEDNKYARIAEVKVYGEEFIEPADKTSLSNRVNELVAMNLVSTDYTNDSWKVYEQALENANNILNKDNASQSEVDDALNTLNNAYLSLKKNITPEEPGDVSKDNLSKYLEANSDYKKEDYTAESYSVYEEALAYANKVLADANATNAEISKAYHDLQAAVNGLDRLDAVITKESLSKYIAKHGNYSKDDYTKKSFKKYQKALDKANKVLKESNATQKEIEAAYNALVEAVLGLEKVSGNSNASSQNSSLAQQQVPVDDGGPFTTDKCGSVYDRWGNLIWKAPSCKAPVDGNYNIVNTSDK